MTGSLPILTYHSLDSSGSPISVAPRRFAETMRTLASEGFRTVDLRSWVADGRPALERRFAITFDDGLSNCLGSLNVLARHGFSATYFLVTDRIGRDNAWPGQPAGIPRLSAMTWRNVASLSRTGHRVGSHTRRHPRLGGRVGASVEDEMLGSRAAIEERTGLSCTLFAYPYGEASARVRRLAAGHFSASFGTRPASASRDDPADYLPRIDGFDLRSPTALRSLIAGRFGPVVPHRWAVRRFRGRASSALRAEARL